jgi:hypothetical protein
MGETVKRLPLIVLENIISELSSTAQLNFNHRLFRQRQNICLKNRENGQSQLHKLLFCFVDQDFLWAGN